jgi:hypothetical protein
MSNSAVAEALRSIKGYAFISDAYKEVLEDAARQFESDAKRYAESEQLQAIGESAMSSVAEMVAALEVDYDRLEELKEHRKDWLAENTGKFLDPNDPRDNYALACPDEAEELAELADAAGECESREDAEQRIQEDALSVEVRSEWHTPGDANGVENAEFTILLSTGGPATRIVGELSNGEPVRAWIEAQDWFKPWTGYVRNDSDTLLTYCRCFYFGEE